MTPHMDKEGEKDERKRRSQKTVATNERHKLFCNLGFMTSSVAASISHLMRETLCSFEGAFESVEAVGRDRFRFSAACCQELQNKVSFRRPESPRSIFRGRA